MTITTIEGKSLCEQLAESYKRSLPKGRGGAAWTIESFSTWVSLRYPEVRVVDEQEWKGVMAKYQFICEDHGPYEAKADDVLKQTGNQKGSQCAGCMAAKAKQRKDAVTAAFVGQTTPDGHLILEHIGYKASPSAVANGSIGKAEYRYKCGVCGNEKATAAGRNLKTHGNAAHCGCLSKRDSRNTFSRSEAKADAPCFVYLFSTIANTGIKLGISNNIKRRASENYDTQLFVSQSLPRATAWSVEQVLIHRLKTMGLKYDLTNVPAFQETVEAGGSEVFFSVDLAWLIGQVDDLIAEADAIGWQALLDRYIPITEMTHHQLFYWDGEHQRQSSGEGYIGHNVRSVFDLQTI